VPSPPPPATLSPDVIGSVARPLLTTYLLPFEVTSLLLLVAIVGAVLLAKRRV
jgi:NADH-quinone oxidoreductase subunit J